MRAYRRVCNYATAAVKQEAQYQIPTASRTDKNNPVRNLIISTIFLLQNKLYYC